MGFNPDFEFSIGTPGGNMTKYEVRVNGYIRYKGGTDEGPDRADGGFATGEVMGGWDTFEVRGWVRSIKTTHGAVGKFRGERTSFKDIEAFRPERFRDDDTEQHNGPQKTNETVEQVARRNDVQITSVEHAEKTSDITNNKTGYVVSGGLEWDGRIDGELSNVAVVGKHDAFVKLPRGFRVPVVDVRGNSFVWSNIDFDQRARNTWARFYAIGPGMVLEGSKTVGSGGRANPSDGRAYSVRNGAAYYMPAPEGTTNVIRDFTDIHGGELPRKHWGNRPMGIWLGPEHKGTLKVQNTHIEEYGNNGVYATNVPGRVEVEDSKFWNNGVNQIRIAHGHVHDSSIGFDYENTNLSFAKQADHASNGISAEQKKAGGNGKPGPDVKRTTVNMKNVGKGGHGLRSYTIYKPAHFGTIEDVTVHIGAEPIAIAGDIVINGGVEAIRDCSLSGTAKRYASVVNNTDSTLEVENVTVDYPRSRKKSKGSVKFVGNRC